MPQPSRYAFTWDDKVLYDPLEGAQQDFCTANETNVFLWGNRGGGKSYTARWWCHGEALAHPGLVYVIVRKGYPELNLNHLMYLDDEMALFGNKTESRYNSSEHICYYPNGSIGVYRQCASDADVKKVVGAQAAIIVFDEAPEMEWEWIRLIGASVRVKKNAGYKPRVRYLGNPIGPSIDQLWSYFIDKDVNADTITDAMYFPGDWKAIEIRLEDNEHLDVESYKKQFAGIPPHILKAWLDGIKVVDGAYFVLDPKRHHTNQRHGPPLFGHVDPVTGLINPPPYIYRCIDWGWHDEMVCLWVAVYPNGRAIVFRELVRTHTTAKECALLIKSMSEGLHIRDTFCDPSMFPPDGSDVNKEGNIMESNGVPLKASRNDRTACGYAISNWMNSDLADSYPALQFWQPGCPTLCKTLPQMRIDPKQVGRIADSKRDHATITLGYFCMEMIVPPRVQQPGPDTTRSSSIIHQITHPEPTSIFKGIGVRRR